MKKRSAEGQALDILTASGTLDLCFYDWVAPLSLICKGAGRLTSGTSSEESSLSLGSSCTSWQRHRTCGESTDIDFFSAFPKTSQGSLSVSFLAYWVSNKSGEARRQPERTSLLKSRKSNKKQNKTRNSGISPHRKLFNPEVLLRLHIVATALFCCVRI